MGSTTRVDAIMTPAFSDEVVVTSETPAGQHADTTIGVDLSSDFYDGLPTGRNYTAVANVTPGAQADAAGQTFYGSTGAENAYYIDGANTTGIEFGTQGTALNFEFIDEVQVKTGSYNAEFGRATGSVINVVTKSGGNEFHGDVFGYYDADSLQATLKAGARGWRRHRVVQADVLYPDRLRLRHRRLHHQGQALVLRRLRPRRQRKQPRGPQGLLERDRRRDLSGPGDSAVRPTPICGPRSLPGGSPPTTHWRDRCSVIRRKMTA